MDTDSRLGAGVVTLIRLLPAVSRPIAVGLAVLGIASAALIPAGTIVTGWVIGALPATIEDGLGSQAGRHFTGLLAAMAVVLLLSYLIGQVTGLLGGILARRVNWVLRARVLGACMQPAGLDHLHDEEVQTSLGLARELSPGGFTPGMAAASLTPILSARLASVFQSAVLVHLGFWWLALALLGGRALAEVGILRLFFDNLKGLTAAGLDFRRVNWFRDLATTPPAAKEVRVFGLGAWIAARNRDAFHATMAPTWTTRKSNAGRISRLSLLSGAQVAGLVVVTLAAFDGALDLGSFAIAMGAVRGTVGFGAGNDEAHVAYGAAAVPAVMRLEQVVAAPRFAASGAASTAGMPAGEIRFDGVGFAYPGSAPLFDGLDLTIPAGERVAVVGANGAGKTTLIKLLCRLHDPDAGRILVDGIDLSTADPTAWRGQIGVLFQDFLHYQLPARDNVRFGAIDMDTDDEALDALALRVGALDVVHRLDDRWDTPLSSSLTGGTDLSGGEWQRIALARALLAVDAGARLLVLDEPTANLDVRAEAELYERFLELTDHEHGGVPLTSILISHRFSTVRRADRIVVLEGGRIIEDGTHESLVALGGRYAHLFALQAARFADDEERDGDEEPADA